MSILYLALVAGGGGGGGGGSDPFTGAGAYVPGAGYTRGGATGGAFHNSASDSGSADPFTGGGAYTPGTGVTTGAGGGGGRGSADPFTGGGAYTPGTGVTTGASAPASGGGLKYVPMNQCLFFETGKTEGVLKKIAEFGAEVVPPLGSEGEAAMAEIAAVAAGGAVNPETLGAAAEALGLALKTWPADKLFPVLDLVWRCWLNL